MFLAARLVLDCGRVHHLNPCFASKVAISNDTIGGTGTSTSACLLRLPRPLAAGVEGAAEEELAARDTSLLGPAIGEEGEGISTKVEEVLSTG